MTVMEKLKVEASMTLSRETGESGRPSYVVTGPARQAKTFGDLGDAESYYRYYVQRYHQEDRPPASRQTAPAA